MLRQIVYVSHALADTCEADFQEILRCSRRNNPELGITGLLIVSGTTPNVTYTQVIEGDEDLLTPVIEIIEGDRRHSNMLILLDQIVECRAFADWTMGDLTVRQDGAQVEVPRRVADLLRAKRPLSAETMISRISQAA